MSDEGLEEEGLNQDFKCTTDLFSF